MSSKKKSTKESSSSVSKELQDDIDSFEDSLGHIEKQLAPFFKASLKDTKENLSGLELAKLNIVIAYSINTLIYMYLKTQGVSPNEHPVKAELDRVRLYIKKVKELAEKENPQKPTLRLNTEAAQRFITHALSDTLKETEQKLEQDKESKDKDTDKEKASKDKDSKKQKDKSKKDNNNSDKENKSKNKNIEKEDKTTKDKDKSTTKSNKRQSPDKVSSDNSDKKKRKK